jgi:hypothetical protein
MHDFDSGGKIVALTRANEADDHITCGCRAIKRWGAFLRSADRPIQKALPLQRWRRRHSLAEKGR